MEIAVGVVLAGASVAVLAATAFGQQGPSGQPQPKVGTVEISPEAVPVDAGWEGQVGTDANLVGVQWNGDPGVEFTIETRNRNGEWRQASDIAAADTGPDQGSKDAASVASTEAKNVTEPVWVGKGVTGVRVRLESGSVKDVKLHAVDSTRGKEPETNVESLGIPTASTTPAPAATTTTQPVQQGVGLGPVLAAAALGTLAVGVIVRRRRLVAVVIVVAVALVACAPAKTGPPGGGPIPGAIVSRSSWGGDLSWACAGGPEYAYVGTAIVHHTVNSNFYGPGDSVGMIRGIWAYHVLSLGYCDIAYNFIIDNYGTPFEGRMGGIDQPVVGAHSLNFNRGTTGIALLGTFSFVTPSSRALGTLENLIRWKFKVHGVNPFDDSAADILGHRDLFPTACPGQALYNYLPYTRHFVKAYW